MNRQIISLVEEGVTIVTPTRGLAQALIDEYSLHQITLGKTSWSSADIIHWTAWCQRSWERYSFGGNTPQILLNQHQEHSVWMQVIQSSRIASQIIHVSGTMRQAKRAYQYCKAWKIPIFPDDVYLNNDAYQFKQWVDSYEQILQEKRWLDRASLPDVLASLIQSEPIKNVASVAFYGFDEWSPQQQSLYDTLQIASIPARKVIPESKNQECFLHVTDQQDDEIEQAAIWARKILVTCHDIRIGIVIQNLDALRDRVESIFTRHLSPECLLDDDRNDAPFLIARGKPLANYPLIKSAVTILYSLRHSLSIEEIGALLQSPFLAGHQSEYSARAIFYAKLRKNGEQRLSLNRLQYLLETENTDIPCARLTECLSQLLSVIKNLPATALPGVWVVHFSEILNCLGWPGEISLTSQEHQTLEAWKQALDQMLSLDLVSVPMEATAALNKLISILTRTGFQPETVQVPVQIMGPEGAAALEFDHLWISGLHDQAWPLPVQPLPFIPYNLQKLFHVPDASAFGQLQRSREMLSGLINSSGQVVLSYPRFEKDRNLRPCPLLNDIQSAYKTEPLDLPDSPLFDGILAMAETEMFADDHGPAINTDLPVNGGAGIFRDQALCPFRAFARHRLYAESISDVDIGLNPIDRGKLVHRALQLIWDRLKDHRQLKNTSAHVLDEYVEKAVLNSIQQHARMLTETFTEHFQQLEQQRLVRLVHHCLEVDLQRPAFTVIGTEKGHHVQFAGITLSMRLDRIDQLSDGRFVIIDYKTGNVRLSDWEGERPSDPQLPLYAITSDNELAALVYARVKSGEMTYLGLAQEQDLLPGKVYPEENWSQRMQEWKQVLEKLGHEFTRGLAIVAPKDDTACRTCEYHSFCRIYEKVESVNMEEPDE